VGPDAGIRRCILGRASEAAGGDGPGLKKRNGVGCEGRSSGWGCDIGVTRGDEMGDEVERGTGDIGEFEMNEVACVSSGC